MATNLPPFLVNYLLNRGLFSDRFSAREDTQETPKKEEELTFEKVLQDILEGGLDTGDTTSTASVSSAPSSATPSTGGFGLGGIGGLFSDIEQAVSDAFSFDLEQAAIDAVQGATGLDLSFEGLFGIEEPSFISDIQRAAPSTVTSAIMSSPNQSLGAKIGAGLHQGLMALSPFGLTSFGIGANIMGATDPFDPALDVAINYDPVADVTTISRSTEALADEEPDVDRSELGLAFDIADVMAAEQAGKISGMTMDFDRAYSAWDWANPGFGVAKAIDPISQLTNAAVGNLGFGGFGGPGSFASQPDPTSAYGFDPNYHSPSFDPANSSGPGGFGFGAPDAPGAPDPGTEGLGYGYGYGEAGADAGAGDDDGTGGFGVGDADDGAGGGLGY